MKDKLFTYFKNVCQVFLSILEGWFFLWWFLYAWFFIKETLPAYYDEYEVRGYNDGIFQLSLPGIRFNNRNWPHVVKCLRSWSVASMLIVPLPCALLLLFEHPMGYFSLLAGMLLLIAYLAGLFVPLYATAKKYESCRRFSQD